MRLVRNVLLAGFAASVGGASSVHHAGSLRAGSVVDPAAGGKHKDLQPEGKYAKDYVHDERKSTGEPSKLQGEQTYANDYVEDENGPAASTHTVASKDTAGKSQTIAEKMHTAADTSADATAKKVQKAYHTMQGKNADKADQKHAEESKDKAAEREAEKKAAADMKASEKALEERKAAEKAAADKKAAEKEAERKADREKESAAQAKAGEQKALATKKAGTPAGGKHEDLQDEKTYAKDYVHDERTTNKNGGDVQREEKYSKDYVKDENGVKKEKKQEPVQKSSAARFATGASVAILVLGALLSSA